MASKPRKHPAAKTRPKKLEDSVEIKLTVTADHLRRLDRIVEAGDHASRSAAVRRWIDLESPAEDP